MLRNIGSNWFVMAVTGLATFFLMPFNLAHIGKEQYGLWLVISALTAYLYLLHLGVPMASVRQMTQAIAAGDTLKLNRIVSSCAVMYLALGLLVVALGIPVMMFFERTYSIPDELRSSAHWAFVLSLAHTGLVFIAYMPYAILSANQAFVPLNLLLAAAIVMRIAVNIALVLWFSNLMMLGAVILSVTVFEFIISWGYVLRKYPMIRPKLRYFQLETIKEIFGFSVYVFLMALGGQLAFQTSALVIGHYMTNADVVSFAIPNSLMVILMQFLSGIAAVIMPMTTNLQTTDNKTELRAILYKWTKISLALSWCVGLFLLIFGPSFLAFWIQGAYHPESGRALRILMLSYLVFLPIRGVAVPMLMGLGKAKWPTLATLAAGALNIFLSILWVKPYGIEGVAFGALVPNLLLSAAMTYLVCRELDVSIKSYLSAILPLSVIGGLAGLAILGWWHYVWHPSGWVGLGLAGVLTIVVSTAIWTGLVLRHDPHVTVPRLSDILRGRFSW